MSSQSVEFVPLDARARWIKGLLLVTLALAVVGIASGLLQVELLSRAAHGGITDAEMAANDSRQQLIGQLQLLVLLASALAFLIWFHRAHKNLPALGGRELKYSPRWAVGGFFVPFLNFVRPVQVMREVWHGSDPAGTERDASPAGPGIRNQLGTPPLVNLWWGILILSSLVGNAIFRMGVTENPTLDQLQMMSALLVLSDVIDIPSALVAFSLITRITNWQTERQKRMLWPGAPVPGPQPIPVG